jgi:multidrug efflux pump subunit AcrB
VRGTSLIAIFTRHRTASNLLMTLMIVGGLGALSKLNTQFFPDFGIDMVSISVEWPGASAEDVDSNIVQAIEPDVRFLDGVKRVRSSSREGIATIVVEFNPGTDMQAALADVETGVGQVRTLPEDSEKPEIRRVVRYDTISRIAISGNFPEPALKTIAKQIRDDLLDRGIDKVDLIGARDEEIWVEVEPSTLRRLDLTIADISARIAETSRDIPSGDTGGALEQQIRSLGLRRDAAGIGAVEILALDNGQKIFLRDVATVRETFEEGGTTLYRKGLPAIELHVQRSINADALKLANTVNAYLEEITPTLPAGLRVEQFAVFADLIRGRIDLLLYNGLGGLILVILILFVFLNGPVAFWVAAGIPVALLGTMVVMLLTGQSINMVSLFGMIMALGIIVDDAIVVGEHAETQRRAGLPPVDAAIAGARRMAVPVLCSSLTTVAAFSPLLLIGDLIGAIIQAIPVTVITVIFASLIECFLILPGHLRGALGRSTERTSRFRLWFDSRFDKFRNGWFRRTVKASIAWRYVTVAVALGAFVICLGLVFGGRIGFLFFPTPESDRIYANLQMVAGTPRSQTESMLDQMVEALSETEAELTRGEGGLVQMALTRVGTGVGRRPGAMGIDGDQIGGIFVELIPSDERSIRTEQVIEAWDRRIRPLAGLDTKTIVPASAGPPGRDLDLRIYGESMSALRAAADEIKALLERYAGISAVEDDLPYGKEEAVLEVTTRGRALGFSTESVGRQVRDAFEGGIAKRFPRGDEEITVRVQFPRDVLDVGLLETIYLRGADGVEVPLLEVVAVDQKTGFARIKREDGQRQVSVNAEVDPRQVTPSEVEQALWRDGLEEIGKRHEVDFRFAGKAEEREQTFQDMRFGVYVALIAIYIILAWVFSSYAQPLVVMSVIPLGFVGAAMGHYLLGFDLTILSMVALLGLSGIVVNDSIILVSTIEELVAKGQNLDESIVDGTCARLRAVILTSATTIGGLTPLMFETSLQAQFLIPMAVTIVFGLLVTTLLVLLVVPALLAIQADISTKFRAYRARPQSTAAE